MLGISPHTVDQRIMLARGKLHVATRNEVAQAYRRLLAETGKIIGPEIYHRSIYGSPDIAAYDQTLHDDWQEVADEAASGKIAESPERVGPEKVGTTPFAMAQVQPSDPSRSYYHVLPEAFDGRVGTLMRLGAIAMITVFLTLVILGGLAIYSELSHMLDS